MSSQRHHALQVEFGAAAFGEMLPVEAVVEAREHLASLLSQALVLAAQHPQSQRDEEDEDQAAGDGHGDDGGAEPHFLGRGHLLHAGDYLTAAFSLRTTPMICGKECEIVFLQRTDSGNKRAFAY